MSAIPLRESKQRCIASPAYNLLASRIGQSQKLLINQRVIINGSGGMIRNYNCWNSHVIFFDSKKGSSPGGGIAAPYDPGGRTRTRMRPGSTTEKCPGQSSRAIRTSAMTLPTPVGPSAGKRKSTIPQLAGRPERHASSPKSLSKVRSTRASFKLRARTS
jgi:hypothetical protein